MAGAADDAKVRNHPGHHKDYEIWLLAVWADWNDMFVMERSRHERLFILQCNIMTLWTGLLGWPEAGQTKEAAPTLVNSFISHTLQHNSEVSIKTHEAPGWLHLRPISQPINEWKLRDLRASEQQFTCWHRVRGSH